MRRIRRLGSPADSCPTGDATGSVDEIRQDSVNQWMGNESSSLALIGEPFPDTGVEANTDCEVSTLGPTNCSDGQEALATGYGTGDDMNLSAAGYAQAALAVTAADLYPNCYDPSTCSTS